MLKFTPILFALTLAPCVSHAADNCEALRAQIEANVASKGITGFTVTTVDAAATVPGQVVGSCDKGAKKIVYTRGGGAPLARLATTPATAAVPKAQAKVKAHNHTRDQDILTECKDGSVSMGGNCKN